MGGRTQLDALLHIPKVQNVLPDPRLHLKLPNLAGPPQFAGSLCPSLPCASPSVPRPSASFPHVCLSRSWSSVSLLFLLSPAHPVCLLPLPPGPAPPCPPQPQRPHHQRLAATCSWATFSNMTHGKGKEWELP